MDGKKMGKLLRNFYTYFVYNLNNVPIKFKIYGEKLAFSSIFEDKRVNERKRREGIQMGRSERGKVFEGMGPPISSSNEIPKG